MAADPKFDVVHPNAMPTSPYYGCHNGVRPTLGQPVPAKDGAYPYRFSTECRYDLSTTDNRCKGCKHSKAFEDWHSKDK